MDVDWAEQTSTTGGSGALTLTAVTGYPLYTSSFGTTGTRWVRYTVTEYADASRSAVLQAETGIGALVLSTGVLTRTKVLATWDGATYDATSPPALSFGATAAKVRVRCAPSAASDGATMPWVLRSVGDNIGSCGQNVSMLSGDPGNTSAADFEYYSPVWWTCAGEVDQAAVQVTGGGAGLHVKAALFEVGADGGVGRLLKDLTGGTPFDASTTGIKTVAVTGLALPRGWYMGGTAFDGVVSTAGPTVTTSGPLGHMTNGSTAVRWLMFAGNGGSYASFPPAAGRAAASLSAMSLTNATALWLRAVN